MRKLGFATAIALAIASAAANAAPVSYSFESVTRYDETLNTVTIVGVLRGETTPTTLSYTEDTASYMSARCVPIYLTMMDKAGRYYLNLVVDPALSTRSLRNCGLESRT